MARTAVTVSNFAGNGNLADPTGTTADATNGHTVANCKFDRTVLRVTNSSGASKNVTVKAGAYPPAIAAGQGDLVVAVGASATVWIGPFESGRFAQSDGSLSVDLAASTTGTVTAFLLPKAV
jgi:hypothetical protein